MAETVVFGSVADMAQTNDARFVAGAGDDVRIGRAAGNPVADADLPTRIAALLPSGSPSWAAAPGGGANLTYSFMASYPGYLPGSDSRGFAALNEAQQAAARDALATWAEVANITFTEVSDDDAGGTIRFGTNTQQGSAGYAYYPTSHPAGGDVLIANNYSYNQAPVSGGYGPLVFVHELGHALGLKHPGNYGATSGSVTLPAAEDNYRYSIMSYYNVDSFGTYPAAPMLYDIAAVQYLYGANMNTRAGDDTYSFALGKPVVATLWDAGGTDTLDASAITRDSVLQLWEGRFSSIGPGRNGGAASRNVGIAYGVTIENAEGGRGNDQILGNPAANVLNGNDGRDTLLGKGGDDVLGGGAGNDVLRGGPGSDAMDGGPGDDLYYADNPQDMVGEGGGDGHDRVESSASLTLGEGIEILLLVGGGPMDGGGNASGNRIAGTPGANVLSGEGGDDTLVGNAGDDTLNGGDGNDLLRAGPGEDVLFGGEGDDILTGAGEHDELTGGGGADRFVFRSGSGRDRIADFNAAEGDRIVISEGMSWRSEEAPEGSFVIFGETDRLRLVGISAGSITADWFVSG